MTRTFLRGAAGFTLARLALAALITMTGAAAAAPRTTPAWAQDGYGPGNTGYNPAEPTINASTIGRLTASWTVTPRPGTEGCFDPATPVVADGRMFIVDSDGVGAYRTATGRLLWRNPDVLDTKVGRTLTVAGGLVLSTGWGCFSVSNPSGHIAALDVRTGKERWHVLQGDAIESVVADQGMVIAYASCDACGSTSVTGYRLSDGARRWGYDNAVTGPVSAGGRLLLTGPGAGSYAVAATTGTVLWRSPAAWSVRAANPAGTQFYATDRSGVLAAIDAATGKLVWSAWGAAGPLAADGRRVYVSRNGVTAFDATRGRMLWHRKADVPAGRPIRAGGLLYLPGTVLSPATGATLPAKGYGTADDHVVVVGGRVYTIKDGTVRTFTPAPTR